MYDRYDTSGGLYGSRRAVQSSHLQVLTETGWAGGVIWVSLFAIPIRLCMRVRRRSAEYAGWEGDRYLSIANASLASMAGFLVGESFVSMALNDLTWLTFGVIASLDGISRNIGTAPAIPAVRAAV
jgi:hypothetical protein